MVIETLQPSNTSAWDKYVNASPKANLYHLSGWQNIIEKTYGHKTYYLMVRREPDDQETNPSNSSNSTNPSNPSNTAVVGILPLVHLKHFIFGNILISLPFFDLGGILADNEDAGKALLSEAIKLAHELKANTIELRHVEPLPWLTEISQPKAPSSNPHSMSYVYPVKFAEGNSLAYFTRELSAKSYTTKSHKVRMVLTLPDSSRELMKSFKAKLRSQIKKPIKEGLLSKVGGLELLNDFYNVFLINMRDLGSPVHSKNLMQNVLDKFPDTSHIVVVYKGKNPVACSMVVGFKDTLENPWSSSLRKYSRLSPNMLLYWTMLEYACDHGFQYFDFGRSSPDEGTYKFKEQWGAKPTPLHWHYISLHGKTISEETSEKSRFQNAIRYWQKLPVSVTKVLGPPIRKHIGL